MTNDTSAQHVPALKDGQRAHPVASAWRPAFRSIVDSLAKADFAIQTTASGVDALTAAKVKQIGDYLAQYGESLVALPEEAWKTSVCQWMGGHWEVLVDLWTRESGASDLVLAARVFEHGASYRIAVHAVYVP
jgi:hypothetical protein